MWFFHKKKLSFIETEWNWIWVNWLSINRAPGDTDCTKIITLKTQYNSSKVSLVFILIQLFNQKLRLKSNPQNERKATEMTKTCVSTNWMSNWKQVQHFIQYLIFLPKLVNEWKPSKSGVNQMFEFEVNSLPQMNISVIHFQVSQNSNIWIHFTNSIKLSSFKIKFKTILCFYYFYSLNQIKITINWSRLKRLPSPPTLRYAFLSAFLLSIACL